jgi:hypothetical protein
MQTASHMSSRNPAVSQSISETASSFCPPNRRIPTQTSSGDSSAASNSTVIEKSELQVFFAL